MSQNADRCARKSFKWPASEACTETDTLTTTAQRMLASIRELAPAITARAAEIEANREVLGDLLDALRSIGVFRIFVPQSHGGDLAHFRKHGYSGWRSEGFWALVIHRLRKAVRRCRPRLLWLPIRLTLGVVNKLFTMVTHTNIHLDAQIGPGLFIPHVGLRVHGNTKIGADCTIHQVCTVGAGPRPAGAIIGDHVSIGCHSSIIGAVHIGDGAVIAPNSLVISDVPAGAMAMGVPAKYGIQT